MSDAPGTFTCAHCGGTFGLITDPAEVDAERERLWGIPEAECTTICDDCFHEFMPWAHAQGLVKPDRGEP